MPSLNHAALLILALAPSLEALAGDTVIINKSRDFIYIAVERYTGGGHPERSAGDGYALGDYRPAGWRTEYWKKIAPGSSFITSSDSYVHVQQHGKPITWAAQKTNWGLIHPTSAGNVFIEKNGREGEQAKKLITSKGLKSVDFQKLGEGVFHHGSSHQLSSKTFRVNMKTRDPKWFSENFHVPGTVTHIAYKLKRFNDNDMTITRNKSHVNIGVGLKGWRQWRWEARKEGYVRGDLTVYYTTPKQPLGIAASLQGF